ncbi:MAG: glycosyltransferase family 4 protein [Deferrisomatales bacterium]
MTIRICLFCQEDVLTPQGGIGTYVRNLGLALAAKGHDVHVISRRRGHAPRFEAIDGLQLHRVEAPGLPVLYSPVYFWQACRKFEELSRTARFDVLHGNMPLMSSWAARRPNLPPVVETVHCTVQEELRAIRSKPLRSLNLNEVVVRLIARIWLARERVLLGRASALIAVSSGLRRELVEQSACPAERVVVIPNGVDYDRFARARGGGEGDALRAKLGIAPEERVILYLGRLVERKRVLDLVQALPRVRKTVRRARLLVVGRRTHNSLLVEQKARELGVAGAVTHVDHVAYADVPAYYALADVYALPSAYEGFPFTILEAMAAGTPVCASRIPGIDEQVESGRTGLLHPVGEIDALADNLLRVLEKADLAASLAEAAQRMVREEYSLSVMADRTLAVLCRAAEGGASGVAEP